MSDGTIICKSSQISRLPTRPPSRGNTCIHPYCHCHRHHVPLYLVAWRCLVRQRKLAFIAIALYNLVPLFFSKSGTLFFTFFSIIVSDGRQHSPSFTRHAFVVPSFPKTKTGRRHGQGRPPTPPNNPTNDHEKGNKTHGQKQLGMHACLYLSNF